MRNAVLSLWFMAALFFSDIAGAIPLFSDDFNRGNSSAVGNGWNEADGTNLNSFIDSNALVMSQTGGLPADPNDGQDTRIFRLGSQQDNILLSGTLSVQMSGPGGAQQAARVVVRSTGTGGSGSGVPCGTHGSSPPSCWRGDGFGFALFTDTIDQEGASRIQITDDGLELIGVDLSVSTGVIYDWEMKINSDNQIDLFFWTGAKPSVPTLQFDNGGSFYSPLSNGNLWQLEVKNTNDNIGSSHTHTTTWDDFQITVIPEPSTALLLGLGLAGLATRQRRIAKRE